MNAMKQAHGTRPYLIAAALTAVRRWTQHLRLWIHEASRRMDPMLKSPALIPIRIQHARSGGDVRRRIGH